MQTQRTSHDYLVALRGVSKSFAEGETTHCIFEDLDLEVERGGFVALLGRSGSGKSTLLNLISGIDVPDAGEITVAGTQLHRVGEHGRSLFRRRHIGFIFQFFNLLPTLTVEENVLLPMQLNAMTDGAAAARQLLSRVDLEDRAGSFPDRLSGGEQQRVAIARALAHDPEILLADEPTGNLDADIAGDVLALLLDLARRRGKTLIVATHSHTVAACADRVLRVQGHALVETPKDTL